MILPLGEDGFTEVRLKRQCGFGGVARFVPEGHGWRQSRGEVADRVGVGEESPAEGEFRVQPDCFAEIFLRAQCIGGRIARS